MNRKFFYVEKLGKIKMEILLQAFEQMSNIQIDYAEILPIRVSWLTAYTVILTE